MKIAIWALGGIIAIIIVVFAAGAYWATSVKVDFKNPETVAKLKDTFPATCRTNYQQHMSKVGKTATDEQLAKLAPACICWRDGVMTALAKREPMTAVEVAGTLSSDPEFASIWQSCSTQYGIEEPL